MGMTVVMDMRDEPDFIEAMKGQRMMSSVHNKLNSELARVKIALDKVAAEHADKLNWFRTLNCDRLFHDLPSLVSRLSFDDFQIAVNARIESYKKDEEAKIKVALAEQEKMLAEKEEAKQICKDKGFQILSRTNVVDEFIALGGIPDDLVGFVRVTLTRFIVWCDKE